MNGVNVRASRLCQHISYLAKALKAEYVPCTEKGLALGIIRILARKNQFLRLDVRRVTFIFFHALDAGAIRA